MIDSLLKIAESALGIWASKEKTKYADALIKLKTEYYEEISKEAHLINDARIVDIVNRLRILTDSLAAAIGSANS